MRPEGGARAEAAEIAASATLLRVGAETEAAGGGCIVVGRMSLRPSVSLLGERVRDPRAEPRPRIEAAGDEVCATGRFACGRSGRYACGSGGRVRGGLRRLTSSPVMLRASARLSWRQEIIRSGCRGFFARGRFAC